MLSDYKITQEESSANGVVSAPDVLTGTAQENKAIFDKLTNQVVITKHNGLIDELATSGAGDTGIENIEGLVATTVQEALEEINQNYEDILDPANTDTASKIGVTPFDGVDSSNVQAALQEIQGNLDLEVNKIENQFGSLTADEVKVAIIPGLTATNVQEALEEVKGNVDNVLDPTDNETAGKLGFTPFPNVNATNVQDAVEEVQHNLEEAVAGIQQDIPTASEVPSDPFPGVASDNVQGALEELGEKIDDIQAGVIPSGSITGDMIQDGAITPDKLAAGAGGGSILTVTFANGFQGATYTLIGGGESYSGTVGNSLKATFGLLATNTTYTLTLTHQGAEHEFEITTEGYYKDLELSAAVVVESLPVQSGTLTYTGEAQSPTWTNYDTNTLTISGDTSKTNAGTYQATFTPKAGCVWWDGTATGKQASWSIGRATAQVPTANQDTLAYTGSTQSPTFNGYDPDKMTIGGDTEAVDVGDYQTTFTPKANYEWPDMSTTAKTVDWEIVAAEVDVPTVSGTLTYNGTVQSPVLVGYDEDTMLKGGTTSATNAGNYTITFTPINNYQWSDGTTDTKSVAWSIGKAVPVLSLSPNSVSVSTETPSATVAITYTGDGTLSVTSNSIAEGSISGTTLTVTGLSTGETSLTVSAAAGTNYQAASASVAVNSTMSTSFSEDSWSTIQANILNGTYSTKYQVGETKDITLTGIGTMTLQIADFDHDYLSGSTSANKAAISLITKHLLPSTKQMNSTNTNVGGFPASDLCEYLNDTIYAALPEDLKSLVVPIYKWYGTGNNTKNGAWHGSKLWVPLEYEMFGTTTVSPATEHTTGNARKYPIFTDNASRIKRMNNGSGDANWYWEASPRASYATFFCTVNGDGGASAGGASDAGGVCFGLCIGAPAGDFATDSWETIAAVAENGTASQFYSIGDTKDIELSGIGTMTLEIADFDHDYLSGSTSASKAGISFITKNLLYTNYRMNTSSTNVGGFPDSKLYETLSTTIWNAIPAECRNVIKTVYKWYGTDNKTSNGQWFGSKIWVPLEYEMFGTTTYSPATEHSTGNARKYPIFTNNASRIKRLNNGSGSKQWYWEASPYAGNTTSFCTVGSGGGAAGYNATDAYGVCFGLCV